MHAPPITPGGDPSLTPEPSLEPIGEIRSPRQIRRARRRVAFARFWKEYRRSKMGMLGLIILVFFIGVAIFAIFADDSGTNPSLTTDGPVGAPPSREYPFGTDGLGLSVLTLVIQGTQDLAPRRAHGVGDHDGGRHARRASWPVTGRDGSTRS